MKNYVVVFLCLIAYCRAISEEEVQFFGTSGRPEQNTGIVPMVSVTDLGDKWKFVSNGIPDHDTGIWPLPGVNPNSIQEQSNDYTLPKKPKVASNPSCLPAGPIAMAVNGVMMFNPWNDGDENAVEGATAEIFDECDGHPDQSGVYHYHQMPDSCLFQDLPGPSPLIGVALDGFAIYGPNDENGNRLTSADLDECHGRYTNQGVYQYHTTSDFPYILGCFKGTPRDPQYNPERKCYFASNADESGNIIRSGPFAQNPTVRPTEDVTAGASPLFRSVSYVLALSSFLVIIIAK